MSIWRWAAPSVLALTALFAGGSFLYTRVVAELLSRVGALPPPLLLVLALVGGAASFFSPCSLAITPSFLARFSEARDTVWPRRLSSGSLALSAGVLSFYGAAGLLVGWVGATAYNYLIYLIPAVGLAFLALAWVLLLDTGRAQALLGWLNPASRYGEALFDGPAAATPWAMYRYGLAYGAASHTCTLPVFLGILLAAFATGSWWLAAATVLSYGAAIAALVLTMLLLGQDAVRVVRRWVGRGGLRLATGALFGTTGLYLLFYFAQNYGGLL